jgi:putative transcriptional regulator
MTITIRHPQAPLRRRPHFNPVALKTLREEVYAYTQVGMASVLGLTWESYRKYETNGRIPGTSAGLVIELFIGDPELIRHAVPRHWDQGRICNLREELDMSQAAFAMLLNVSVDTVKKWEKGKRKPSRAAAILLEILATEPESAIFKIVENARQSLDLSSIPMKLHQRSKRRHEPPQKLPEDQMMLAIA